MKKIRQNSGFPKSLICFEDTCQHSNQKTAVPLRRCLRNHPEFLLKLCDISSISNFQLNEKNVASFKQLRQSLRFIKTHIQKVENSLKEVFFFHQLPKLQRTNQKKLLWLLNKHAQMNQERQSGRYLIFSTQGEEIQNLNKEIQKIQSQLDQFSSEIDEQALRLKDEQDIFFFSKEQFPFYNKEQWQIDQSQNCQVESNHNNNALKQEDQILFEESQPLPMKNTIEQMNGKNQEFSRCQSAASYMQYQRFPIGVARTNNRSQIPNPFLPKLRNLQNESKNSSSPQENHPILIESEECELQQIPKDLLQNRDTSQFASFQTQIPKSFNLEPPHSDLEKLRGQTGVEQNHENLFNSSKEAQSLNNPHISISIQGFTQQKLSSNFGQNGEQQSSYSIPLEGTLNLSWPCNSQLNESKSQTILIQDDDQTQANIGRKQYYNPFMPSKQSNFEFQEQIIECEKQSNELIKSLENKNNLVVNQTNQENNPVSSPSLSQNLFPSSQQFNLNIQTEQRSKKQLVFASKESGFVGIFEPSLDRVRIYLSYQQGENKWALPSKFSEKLNVKKITIHEINTNIYALILEKDGTLQICQINNQNGEIISIQQISKTAKDFSSDVCLEEKTLLLFIFIIQENGDFDFKKYEQLKDDKAFKQLFHKTHLQKLEKNATILRSRKNKENKENFFLNLIIQTENDILLLSYSTKSQQISSIQFDSFGVSEIFIASNDSLFCEIINKDLLVLKKEGSIVEFTDRNLNLGKIINIELIEGNWMLVQEKGISKINILNGKVYLEKEFEEIHSSIVVDRQIVMINEKGTIIEHVVEKNIIDLTL